MNTLSCTSRRPALLALLLALTLAAAEALAQAPLPPWAEGLTRPRLVIDGGFLAAEDFWVVQYSEILVSRTEEGHLRRTYRQILQPLFDEGEEKLQLSIPFNQASQILKGPRVWIPKGRRHEQMDLTDSIDVPLIGGSTITAMRTLLVKTPPIAGARRGTVVAEWTVEDKVDFPGEDVLFPLDFYPTIELLVRPDATDPDAPHLRLVQPNGEVERVPAQGISLFDIPASQHLLVEQEHPWLASLFSSVPFVHATLHGRDGESWQEVAERTRALFDLALASDTPEPYLAQARALTADLDSDAERIAALAAFTQALTYRDIQWGIGAFQPEVPSQVLRTRSADCKGKTLLLHAMLDAVGIRSTPVLVNIGDRYQDYEAPASPLAFNHVVLAIDAPDSTGLAGRLRGGPGAGWVLFDPTDALATYGQPSHRVMQRQGLWLDQGGELFRIEQVEATAAERVMVKAALTEEGDLTFTVRLSGPGEYAYDTATGNASPQRMGDLLRRDLTERFREVLPGLRLEASRYTPPNHRDHEAMAIHLEGVVPGALSNLGDGLYSLEAPMLLLAELADLPIDGYANLATERTVSVPLGWEVDPCCEAQHHRLLTQLTLTLPHGWRVDHLPRFDTVANDWLAATLESTAEEHTVQWRADLRWSRGRFPDQPADARTAQLNRIVATYQRPILLARDPLPSQASRH